MSKKKVKDIYDLELHESLDLEELVIIRVPGGWVYHWDFDNNRFGKSSQFVPFNHEFQKYQERLSKG